MSPLLSCSSFPDSATALTALKVLRSDGKSSCLQFLDTIQISSASSPLSFELLEILTSRSSPRILIDSIWLCNEFGGISRVWQNIISSLRFFGLDSPHSAIYFIQRSSSLANLSGFNCIAAPDFDPFDYSLLAHASELNSSIVAAISPDVFCSTWITSTSLDSPLCPELLICHDFLPEIFKSTDPHLPILRRRWLEGASCTLSVSADTASFVSSFSPSSFSNHWCHLPPHPVFSTPTDSQSDLSAWRRFIADNGLPSKFILLPSSGSIGSYKNPQLVAEAILLCGCDDLHLLITSPSANLLASALSERYPKLSQRIHSAFLDNAQLKLAYNHAIAVVMPSRAEGFGLPVVEAIASGGIAVVADVLGLRESGSEAAFRFIDNSPESLASFLDILVDPVNSSYFSSLLSLRSAKRLSRLHPDLFSLCFLASARQSIS